MIDKSTLEAMTRPLGEARPLPASFYQDPTILDLEYGRFFRKGWISIGFGSQVKNPGDMLPVSVVGEQLLLVRDLEGTLRVFHNVCRHRGLLLVDRPTHVNINSISCPYHRWGYALNGECAVIPYWDRAAGKSIRPDEKQLNCNLSQVRMRVWFDIVFVDLSGKAPAFEELVAPLEKRWRMSSVSRLTSITTWEAAIPANWKLVVENFLDVYHLAFVHQQAGSIKAAADHDHLVLSRDIIGYRLENAALTKSRSGPIPIVPELENAVGVDGEVYFIFPNTMMFLQRTFMSLRTLLPRGTTETYEVNLFYVSDDTANGPYEAEREKLSTGAHLINDQDIPILVRLQATRGSMVADDARFAPSWDHIPQQFQIRIAEGLLSAETA